jgi:hypothetical protein
MKARSVLFLGAVAGGVFAQDAFEPSDFNVTEALIENGVNFSALPELAVLTEKRSLANPCAVAVGNPSLPCCLHADTCQSATRSNFFTGTRS